MSPTTGGLKELHVLHQRLHDKKSELEAGPRSVAIREGLCKKKQVEIDGQKDLITSHQKAADDKNLQFKTNEQKIVELKAKLNSEGKRLGNMVADLEICEELVGELRVQLNQSESKGHELSAKIELKCSILLYIVFSTAWCLSPYALNLQIYWKAILFFFV